MRSLRAQLMTSDCAAESIARDMYHSLATSTAVLRQCKSDHVTTRHCVTGQGALIEEPPTCPRAARAWESARRGLCKNRGAPARPPAGSGRPARAQRKCTAGSPPTGLPPLWTPAHHHANSQEATPICHIYAPQDCSTQLDCMKL